MQRGLAARYAVKAAVALLAAVAPMAAATALFGEEPRGPEPGNNAYSAAILPDGAEPDVDTYVATLALGETLAVTVAASSKSALQPTLEFVDPAGLVVDPKPRVRGGGRELVVKAFTVTSTGTWAVRVGAAPGTQGEYSIRSKVKPQKSLRLAKQALGGATPLTGMHAFEAVEGSTLAVTIKASGDGAPVTPLSVTGPEGAVSLALGDLRVKGKRTTLTGLSLTRGSGTYQIGVGIGAGAASYSLSLTARPPARPTGTRPLGSEALLAARGTPLDGTGGQVARLMGSNFPTAQPYAKVWIGGVSAPVVAVGTGGGSIDVMPAHAPGDTIADVTVQNPDGQATTRTGYFHYIPLGPVEIAAIEPGWVRIAKGTTQTFVVRLTRVVAPPGIDVALAATGAVGTLPSLVHIAYPFRGGQAASPCPAASVAPVTSLVAGRCSTRR